MPVIPPEGSFRTDLDFSALTQYATAPTSANESIIKESMSAKSIAPVKSVDSTTAINNAISSVKSKTFSVQSTKQVVKEIRNSVPALLSKTDIRNFGAINLQTLMSKVGSDVSTTEDLYNAVDKASVSFLNTKSSGNKLSGSFENLSSAVMVAAPDKSTNMISSYINDTTISSIFPNTITTSGFNDIKSALGDLDNFNSCPNLANLGSGIFDLSGLLSKFGWLVGLVGMFDLLGILNCVGSVTKEFDVLTNKSMVDTLVDKGSLNGLSDLTSVGSISSVEDGYRTVRSLSNNRLVKTDQYSGRITNTWTNPSVSVNADRLMTNLNIDKNKMFSANSTAKNISITDSLADPIYDLSLIRSSKSLSRFNEYCIGTSNAELLSAIPS